jgi:2-polyprenyl-3-methyl-5-hydroxy-6-metoxy-1,4-benzoquinol methylase
MSDRLRETRQAFDSVAADYDGQRGNNELIQDMRSEMWRWLDATFAPHSRLIDIGCGTGLDAIRMAQLGHRITAIDWSPQMAHRTAERASGAGVAECVQTVAIGAQELSQLEGTALYDGAYSNLGPLNCVPGLDEVSRQCARLLKPGAALVFTVIGRVCPWEMVHYILKGRWARARIRYAPDFVAVGMNKRTIWTHYYQPREFYRYFQGEFELQEYRGLCTFAPPPYLTWMRDRHPRWYDRLWRLDRRLSGFPLLRDIGDHFLMVMKRRA